MRSVGHLLLCGIFSLMVFSCNKKIDNPQLIETLQQQVDSIIQQGFRIDKINVYTKNYSNHGPGEVGYLDFMFVDAVSPDSTIEYLANFSYSSDLKRLSFHGYPVKQGNKRKDKVYDSVPDLRYAISRLDEVKGVIPDNYTYKDLLSLTYFTEGSQDIYKFVIEVSPESEELSHPNVKQEKKSYVKYTRTKRRKMAKEKVSTDIKRKIQHSITVKLIDGQIRIQ